MTSILVLFGSLIVAPTVASAQPCISGEWKSPFSPVFSTGQSHAVENFEKLNKLVLLNGGPEYGIRKGQKMNLYELTTKGWEAMLADEAPELRNYFATAYDSHRGALVLHGGLDSERTFFTTTWEWNGTAWTEKLSAGPGPREGALMCYDPVNRRTLLYGGSDDQGQLKGDTWAWDGREWKQVTLAGPSPRFPGALFFDPASSAVYLYGGHDLNPAGFQFLKDLWKLENDEWKLVDENPLPGVIYRPAITPVPACGGVLLSGGGKGTGQGSDRFSDKIWLWNGADFSLLETRLPLACANHSLNFDEKNARLLMHGGLNRPGGKPLSQSWLIELQ